MRSGVHWMRPKLRPITWRGAHQVRLAEAGHAFEQRMATTEHGDEAVRDEIIMADDALLNVFEQFAYALAEVFHAFGGLGVVLAVGGCGVGAGVGFSHWIRTRIE